MYLRNLFFWASTSTTCSTVSTNGFDSRYRELELIKPVAFFPLLVSKVQIPFLLRSAHSPRRNLRDSSEMQARTGSDVTTAQSPGDVTAVTWDNPNHQQLSLIQTNGCCENTNMVGGGGVSLGSPPKSDALAPEEPRLICRFWNRLGKLTTETEYNDVN